MRMDHSIPLLALVMLMGCGSPTTARVAHAPALIDWDGPWEATIVPAVPDDLQVVVLQEEDVGSCNPLCKGRCVDGRCLELPDVDGMSVSSLRRKGLDVVVKAEGSRLKVRPAIGTWRPQTEYIAVVTSSALEGRTTAFTFLTTASTRQFVTPGTIYPAHGSREVGVNVAWVLVSYPCKTADGDEALLVGDDGSQIPLVPAGEGFWASEGYVRPYLVGDGLSPGVKYSLWIGGVRTRCGEGTPWLLVPWFTTGEHAWLKPATISEAVARRVGRCCITSIASTGPAMVTLSAGRTSVGRAFVDGTARVVMPICPDGLIYSSMEGYSNSMTIEGPVTEILPSPLGLRLKELMPNPEDPEPACEYVSIVNMGSSPIPLEGWRLTDSLDATGDLLPDATLMPGQEAVLVTSRFSEQKCPAESGLLGRRPILVLDSSMANGGLSNRGEPLYLIDPQGRLADSWLGWSSPSKHEGERLMSREQYTCDEPSRWQWTR